MLANIMPLARSPFGKKDATGVKQYGDKVHKAISDMTPWRARGSQLRERLLSMGVKPGEVVVLLDSNDLPNDPLYKDAKVIKR